MKKKIALNKFFNFGVVMLVFSVFFAFILFQDKEKMLGAFFLLTAFGSLGILVFSPYCYKFDIEGISLCYLFLPVERYLWNNISDIEVDWKQVGRPAFFDVLYASVFRISGVNEGKHRFYMEGTVRKSFRTKYLFEKYWDGTITGYLLEDAKKWMDKKRKKKQVQIAAHLTDEVVAMEREVRATARELINPFVDEAKLYGFKVRTQYIYITDDFEELKSRPKEKYTYIALMEIARPDETDKDKIYEISAELMYGRLGKNSYRGVKNKYLLEELKEEIDLTLKEIRENKLLS